jgi:hypothetical protein
MIPPKLALTTTLLSLSSVAIDVVYARAARSLAVPAIQHSNAPRAVYQGGWPLALAGTASTTCPSEATVFCSTKQVNPACCPTGQTCVFNPSLYVNYCCPSGNFPLPFFFFPHSGFLFHMLTSHAFRVQEQTATPQSLTFQYAPTRHGPCSSNPQPAAPISAAPQASLV